MLNAQVPPNSKNLFTVKKEALRNSHFLKKLSSYFQKNWTLDRAVKDLLHRRDSPI